MPTRHTFPDIESLLDASVDPAWSLTEAGFDLSREQQVESRLALSNGFIGIRGDIAVAPLLQKTYVAGHFAPGLGPSGVPGLVPAPPPFPLKVEVDGEELDISLNRTLDFVRTFDLRRGLLQTHWRLTMSSGVTVTLHVLRFAARADSPIAGQIVRLRVNQPAVVALELAEAGTFSQEHTPVEASAGGAIAPTLAYARTARVFADGSNWKDHVKRSREVSDELLIFQLTAYALEDDESQALDKVAIAIRHAGWIGVTKLLERHTRAWESRWADCRIDIEGDDDALKALRFAAYHLLSAADPEARRASIAARGLTGDAYAGHVFWDTEIFLVPFYALVWPIAARAMLMYRYRTLDAARRKAATLGYRGALYAWESADTGDEATPPYVVTPENEIVFIRSGSLEHHISADISFAIWRYWVTTRDADFLLEAGAEIILETARFWCSRASHDGGGLYHIRNVIGPDEYHDDVDDNAFTNGMAIWNIRCALKLISLLGQRWPLEWQRLQKLLRLDQEELGRWREVADRLILLEDERSGVLEQFQGYFSLEHIDLASFNDRMVPMDVLIGAERVKRSQIIKQADVIMLIALLPDLLDETQQLSNFSFYESCCSHGSLLSPAIHALVAARLGASELALRYFRQNQSIDLNDSLRSTAGGLHMAALGGLWQTTVFGFAGLELHEDCIELNPVLPTHWRSLTFRARWRRRSVQIELSQLRCVVRLLSGRSVTIRHGETRARLIRGQPIEFRIGRSAPSNL